MEKCKSILLAIFLATFLLMLGSATKLKTARTIGISGGATGTATSFNGTGNITIPVTSLDATKLTGTANIDTNGNASTSTKLRTARNIALTGAVSGNANFDGSGNITISTTQSNIAVLTGSFTTDGTQEGSATIAYPSGFNNSNCVVISYGIGRNVNEYNYGTQKQNSGATLGGNPLHWVKLQENGILVKAKYDIDGLTQTNTLYYKIALMKI